MMHAPDSPTPAPEARNLLPPDLMEALVLLEAEQQRAAERVASASRAAAQHPAPPEPADPPAAGPASRRSLFGLTRTHMRLVSIRKTIEVEEARIRGSQVPRTLALSPPLLASQVCLEDAFADQIPLLLRGPSDNPELGRALHLEIRLLAVRLALPPGALPPLNAPRLPPTPGSGNGPDRSARAPSAPPADSAGAAPPAHLAFRIPDPESQIPDSGFQFSNLESQIPDARPSLADAPSPRPAAPRVLSALHRCLEFFFLLAASWLRPYTHSSLPGRSNAPRLLPATPRVFAPLRPCIEFFAFAAPARTPLSPVPP